MLILPYPPYTLADGNRRPRGKVHTRARVQKKEKKKNALLRVHTNGEREELEVIRYNGATSIYVTHVHSCIHMHVTKRYNISFNK